MVARPGFITEVNATEIGHAIAAIGGGRVRIEDSIDPKVGFVAEVKIGDRVKAGAPIGFVLCDDERKGQEAAERIRSAYKVEQKSPAPMTLIKEIINE